MPQRQLERPADAYSPVEAEANINDSPPWGFINQATAEGISRFHNSTETADRARSLHLVGLMDPVDRPMMVHSV